MEYEHITLEKCKNCKYRYICGTGCPVAKHMSENDMNIKEPSCVDIMN